MMVGVQSWSDLFAFQIATEIKLVQTITLSDWMWSSVCFRAMIESEIRLVNGSKLTRWSIRSLLKSDQVSTQVWSPWSGLHSSLISLIRSPLKSDHFDQVSTQVWSPWSGLHSGLINFDQVSDQVWSGLHSGQINFWSGLWPSLITPADQALDQSESSLVNFKMSDFITLVSVQPPSRPIRMLVSKFFWTFLCNLIGRERTIVLSFRFTPKMILIEH